jgi:hypothetical protein
MPAPRTQRPRRHQLCQPCQLRLPTKRNRLRYWLVRARQLERNSRRKKIRSGGSGARKNRWDRFFEATEGAAARWTYGKKCAITTLHSKRGCAGCCSSVGSQRADFTVVSRACIRLHALPHQSEDDQRTAYS